MPGYIAPAARDDWRTPNSVLDVVRAAFGGGIDLDPCPSKNEDDWFGEENFVQPKYDGLCEPWRGRTFVNPPFADLDLWCEASVHAHVKRGADVIMLLPARTDTRYWHDCVAAAAAVCFWKGRIRFVGAEAPCPFPVAFAYWGARPWNFHEVFRNHGWVVSP